MRRNSLILISLALIVALLAASTALTQENALPAALSSLVEAERAFARTSVERGVRESFLAFFAEDGVNFTPHPVKTRQNLLSQPAPAVRPPITLNWQPLYADVSQAGDLGYTTGPYIVTDTGPQQRPPRHGYYFSIWKKQQDGSWKVVVDLGIQTPTPPTEQEFHAAKQIAVRRGNAGTSVERERAELLNMEREFLKAAQSRGVAAAYLSYMSDDARLHRNGMLPLTNREAIRSYFAGKKVTLTWEPIKSDAALSGDLGYVYGSYEQRAEGTQASTAPTEKGYYVHVWKRDASGRWKVVLDTTNPIPPEQ